LVKQIRLNLIFHTSGRHDAGWKSFEDPTTLVDDVDHQIMLARLAEDAKFDAIFLPDTHAVLGTSFLRKPRRGLDPIVLLAAIARETQHLGLISTASALTGHPYVVARSIATLQHISKGRAGWNIVTSQDDQALQALGLPIDEKLDRRTRYERAAEFVEIVTAMWDSFPKEAITADKENDVYIDTSLTQRVDYEGKHFRSSGILQLPGRYEGDRPVMFQAGVSPQSREFGARYADVLFTSQPDLDHDRIFYAEAKAHAAKFGRNPDHLVVLPGLYAVVGDSEADARKRKAEFDDLLDLNYLVNNLAKQLGLPVEELDPNKELPYELFDSIPTEDEIINYRRGDIGGVAKANDFTVKQLVHHNVNRGQRAIFGTPEQIADRIIEWVDTDVADGFNINVDVQPDGLERFKRVITELQSRGRYRTEYEYSSFRANYGLPSGETS
jgi:FMN-dependent oxidoreductase (nitrilotriacetate monooxygenase family)